jgi:murein DD-endopeptidase MepM/ murein hydrolase activator NlpD
MSEQALRRFMERRHYRALRRQPRQDAWKDEPVLGCAREQDTGVLGPLPKSDGDLVEIVLDLLAGADDPPLGNEAQALARAGRGSDTEIAHVTPGEIVISKRLQTPEVIAALRRAAGEPLAHLQVGHPRNRINPRTGAAEFDDSDAAPRDAGEAIADRITQSMGDLPDWGGLDENSPAAQPTPQLLFPGRRIRGSDPQGSGAYGASRRNNQGAYSHEGVDIVYQPGETVTAPISGTVGKIGFPYDPQDPKKGSYRYVPITNADGSTVKLFYIDPTVKEGDSVTAGQTPLGISQDLAPAFPGITNHVHVEVSQGGRKVNPTPSLSLGK